MKLTVHILDGKSFVMNAGTGNNTVKWLSFAAGQRAASVCRLRRAIALDLSPLTYGASQTSAPGRRRARDTGRMGGKFVVHHISSSGLERQVRQRSVYTRPEHRTSLPVASL